MDITLRDGLYALGLIGVWASNWIAMDRKVTRLEALAVTVKENGDRTAGLERYRETSGREVGEIAISVEELARRVLALEGEVKDGFKEVLAQLAELKGRMGHDRRTGA